MFRYWKDDDGQRNINLLRWQLVHGYARPNRVQGGKKNLSVAIIDEYFRFNENTCKKLETLTLNFKIMFLFVLYSTHKEP